MVLRHLFKSSRICQLLKLLARTTPKISHLKVHYNHHQMQLVFKILIYRKSRKNFLSKNKILVPFWLVLREAKTYCHGNHPTSPRIAFLAMRINLKNKKTTTCRKRLIIISWMTSTLLSCLMKLWKIEHSYIIIVNNQI